MNSSLDESRREECSIEELARIIFCHLKAEYDKSWIGLQGLREKLCPRGTRHGKTDDDRDYIRKNSSFLFKFYEAIGRLKQRGLLMEANKWCCEDYHPSVNGGVRLTSIGEKSDFDEGLLILVDDCYEIVKSVKDDAPNLDGVVEQYYLESLRTCQNGAHIASVICLGAASEWTINCLADAVIQRNPQHQKGIDGKRRQISDLTNHLVSQRNTFFKSLKPKRQAELKDMLEGLALIYRQNRNKAGHPIEVPQDWKRNEQECYLNQFRRYAKVCFNAIEELNNAP